MPATAGRVRMPANNRVHSSAALQTHGIWQSAIGYDPYAPNKDDSNPSEQKTSNSETGAENAYASFQGLLALARITGSNADEVRGACKKCFRVGHLTYQCRNFLSVKEDGKGKDQDEINSTVLASIDRLKGNMLNSNGKMGGESSEGSSEEDDSESSDSDVDSEMERIIAERSGKRIGSRRHVVRSVASDDDNCDSKKKRERSRTRRNGNRKERDLSDERVKARIEKRRRRRRRDVSSSDDGDEDDEGHHRHARKSRKDKRRRRSHRRSDDSCVAKDSSMHGKRKSRGQDVSFPDSSEGSSSDDSRVGRSKKRSLKKSHRRHHRYED